MTRLDKHLKKLYRLSKKSRSRAKKNKTLSNSALRKTMRLVTELDMLAVQPLAAPFDRMSANADLQKQWAALVRTAAPKTGLDVMTLLQWTLRQAYLENTADLRAYANKVKAINEQKKALRKLITRLRGSIAAGRFSETLEFDDETYTVNNQEEAEALLTDLETMLNTMGEDNQLAQMQLQDALAQMSQLLQALSNMMKKMHKAQKNLIKNLK